SSSSARPTARCPSSPRHGSTSRPQSNSRSPDGVLRHSAEAPGHAFCCNGRITVHPSIGAAVPFEQFFPRRAIITGAMSGIGRAAAELVLAAGGRVLGIDLNDEAWAAPGLTSRAVDITDADALAAAFAEAP